MMTVSGEMRRSELIFLVPLVVLTVALRLVVLESSEWMTEGDEALTGLMALHILHGDRPVYLNGQAYMGAYQAYVAAGLFAILGVSTIALKIVPLIGSVAFVLSIYMLARRLISPWGACAAGLIAAVPPVYILANMSKAWAPHAEVMALGNVLILLAIRQHTRDARGAEPVLFGALAGFAFWLHPFVAYYLVVCGCILVLGQPIRTLTRLPLLLAGIVVGTMPVWMANVAYASDTFRFLTVPTGSHQDIGAIASYLVYSGLPRAMGWWQPWGVLPQPAAWMLIGTTGLGLLVLFVRGRADSRLQDRSDRCADPAGDQCAGHVCHERLRWAQPEPLGIRRYRPLSNASVGCGAIGSGGICSIPPEITLACGERGDPGSRRPGPRLCHGGSLADFSITVLE